MEHNALSRDAEPLARTRVRRSGGERLSAVATDVLALQRAAGNRAVAQALLVARAKTKSPAAPKSKGGGAKAHVKMKGTKVVPRRSGRVRVPPSAVDLERTWTGPSYGGSSKSAGGTSVTADLGPAAGRPTNYGSTPRKGECTDTNKLNAAKFEGRKWIKGHLLNDNLGGPGLSANLTPITHTANMGYKAVESGVKKALDVCYTVGQAPGTHWYGVHFEARIAGQTAFANPIAASNSVAQTIDAQCHYISKPRAGGAVAPAGATPFTGAPALPGPGVVPTNCFQ